MPHPFFDVQCPAIIGHRGAAGTAPENTLPSFERALSFGADILESDIHETRDGVPVLIHDPDVDRTTNGRGAIEGYTLRELRAFDAAHHFSPADPSAFSERDATIRIPTLEEAFAAFPDARFNLELKGPGPALADSVIDLVEKYSRSDRTLLTAGENDIMDTLRDARRRRGVDFAIGACTADILGCIRAALGDDAPPEDVMALQIPETFGDRPLATPELVTFAHREGIAVHVWTINDVETMQRLLDIGVDGLVTDHPERMAALLGRA